MKNIFILFCFVLLTAIAFAQDAKTDEQVVVKMKPALLVIDIQNEYLPYISEDEKKFALLIINGAIWFFRENNLPIIGVYHSDLNWGPKEGTENFEFPKSVIIQESDTKIHKHYPSAFIETKLDKVLKEKGCNTLFLCGLSATGCVLATYFGSMEHGYKPFMIRDGIMSHNSEYTHMIKDICESMSFETMAVMLQNIE